MGRAGWRTTSCAAARTDCVILGEPVRPSPYPAIFLIGCVRSGTSLVRRIVDSHSRIACPPESHFLAPLLSVLDDRRSLIGLESMGFGRDEVAARMRVFAERFFLEYATAEGKPRWADKTPFYVDHLDAIDEVFGPRTRYVLIYRHGLDVARSMTSALSSFVSTLDGAASGEPADAAAAAGSYWSDKVSRMLAFAERHPDRTHTLRYERLVAAPAREAEAMFTFLEEPFEPAVLDFNAQHHHSGLEDGRVQASRGIEPIVDTWHGWNRAQLDAALSTTSAMLDRLGYAAS